MPSPLAPALALRWQLALGLPSPSPRGLEWPSPRALVSRWSLQ